MAVLLYEEVASSIEKEIRNSGIPLGTPLPSERVLAARYHVSRNVIRQALQQLAGKKLIEIIPGKGSVISHVCDEAAIGLIKELLFSNQDSYLNALEVREVLEVAIIERCILHLTKEDLVELFEIYDKMEFYRRENKVEQFLEGDKQFHRKIAQVQTNPLFDMLLQIVLSNETLDLLWLSRMEKGILEKTQYEHMVILEGLQKRDLERARTAMRQQMENIRIDFSRLIKANND